MYHFIKKKNYFYKHDIYNLICMIIHVKRQLRPSNVKSVENISRKNKNPKICAKKALIFFWFLFGDFNISNTFYKILNLNEWQFVSVITHWTYTFLNP